MRPLGYRRRELGALSRQGATNEETSLGFSGNDRICGGVRSHKSILPGGCPVETYAERALYQTVSIRGRLYGLEDEYGLAHAGQYLGSQYSKQQAID